MSEPHRKSEPATRNGKPAATPPPAEEPGGAIEQAVALRDVLRDAANKATGLIRTLQHDKSRIVDEAISQQNRERTLQPDGKRRRNSGMHVTGDRGDLLMVAGKGKPKLALSGTLDTTNGLLKCPWLFHLRSSSSAGATGPIALNSRRQ